ncbi:Hypothetical protein ACI5QL_01620 [Bacillus velezensis]
MMNTLTGQQRKSSLLWDYLTTVDHKKIAILYMIAGDFSSSSADLRPCLSGFSS